MNPSEERFDRLWREAERHVKGVVAKNARRATREDREDIVQSVRVKAWKGFEGYDPERSFVGWACRIAQNASLDWIRSDAKRTEFDGAEVEGVDERPSPLDLVLSEDVAPKLREALSRLNLASRETFLLCVQGFTFKEVAALTGCSIGAVKAQHNRATARLRTLLGPDFPASQARP